MKLLLIYITVLFTFSNCISQPENNSTPLNKPVATDTANTVTGLEMHLSAFGVESDYAPTIDVNIDFTADSIVVHRSYYNPDIKPSTYVLHKNEIQGILALLKHADLTKLKENYHSGGTDQPTSTTIIYTTKKTYKIVDYGMREDSLLMKLYDMVYKYEDFK